MPVLNAGDLAQIRSRPIGRRFRLYVHQPETQWTGVVAGAPNRGDRDLVVTTATGNAALLYADCTVRVTTAAGDPKSSPSKVRFRSYDIPTTTMTIADNDIDWIVGDLLTGQNLFELWPRFVYADATDPLNPVWYKDRDIAYVDEDTAFAPKSNPGPAAIGMLVGGQCDLIFDGQYSYVSPLGGAVSGYNWAAIGGAPGVVAGNPLTSTVTFRYTAPGFYYVGLTVTDLNAITDVCYIPVIVDDGTLAVDYTYPGDRGWDGSGWSMSRTLPGIDADESLFYDGAPVFLTADDRQVADTSFVANRSNLRFSGWLIEDEVERGRYGRTGRYKAVSSAHVMRGIPAFPTGMRIDPTPTEWDYATTWNIDALITYLNRWHSTVSRVCNVYVTGEWANRYAGAKDLLSNSLLEQQDWLLGGIVGNVRCSRQGGLRPMRHEWFLSAAEEAARNTVMTITNVDWQSARYGPRPHKATVKEFTAGGVTGALVPFLAGSPGQAALEGGKPDERMDLLCNNQAELTRWAGQFLAFRNFNISLILQMSSEYDVVDPSYGEYVTGALNDYDPKLPDGPYAITSIKFRDDHKSGYTLSEWALLPDPVAFGGYGTEDIDIPTIPPPPPPPPINGPPPPPPIPEPEDWPGMVYFCAKGAGVGVNNGGAWLTTDFTPPSVATQPTWDKLNVTGSWPADNYIRSFGIDVGNPGEYVYALTASSRDVIRYSVTAGTWSTILTSAATKVTYGGNAFIGDMMMDRATGYLFVLVHVPDGAFSTYHVAYRCTDPAAGVPAWTSVASGTYWNRGYGTLWAYADQATYVFTADLTGFDKYIDVSTAGGAWVRTQMTGTANVTVKHFHNRDTVDVYHTWSNSFVMGYWQIGGAPGSAVQVCSSAAPVACYDRGTVLPEQVSLFMPSATDSGVIRFLGNYSAYAAHLITTTDKFVTYTDQGHLNIGGRTVSQIAEVVNEDYYDAIIYGAILPILGDEHTIYAAEGDADITPEGKSGAHPDTGIDSIHYLSAGPTWRGIQVVPGT